MGAALPWFERLATLGSASAFCSAGPDRSDDWVLFCKRCSMARSARTGAQNSPLTQACSGDRGMLEPDGRRQMDSLSNLRV